MENALSSCSQFQVREDKYYRAETQHFDLDWTYGVAWGAVCFMIGAAIFFLIRAETQEVTQQKDNTPPPYYLNYTRAWMRTRSWYSLIWSFLGGGLKELGVGAWMGGGGGVI